MMRKDATEGLNTEYDPLAKWYRRWSKADPAAGPSLEFYRKLCCEVDVVIELGVGDGRIAIEVAKRWTRVVGVDTSSRMLAMCRKRARRAGVSERIDLIHGDAREFISSPVPLVVCPFRSIGHLTTPKERLDLAVNVRRHLMTGGRFVFDHYVFDKDWAAQHDGVPRVMCSWDAEDGGTFRIVDTYRYVYPTHKINCSIAIEHVDAEGRLIDRVAHPLAFSWLETSEVHELAHHAGFVVEAVYGDFDGGACRSDSEEQVWVLRSDAGRDTQ